MEEDEEDEEEDEEDRSDRRLALFNQHTSVVPARDFCAHRYEFAAWLSPAA